MFRSCAGGSQRGRIGTDTRRSYSAWGKVKIFAGTLTYKMVAIIPGATPTKLGTTSVKALLNPDTGKWQVDVFQAADPPVSLE